ncbi:hypothetical protein J6590_011479 [Homalodisca vitripennis]|nr:hypothetical protein J6590_011479 [Homalodisca vitripennis]
MASHLSALAPTGRFEDGRKRFSPFCLNCSKSPSTCFSHRRDADATLSRSDIEGARIKSNTGTIR